MRRTIIAAVLLAACSGDAPAEPAAHERVVSSPAPREVEAVPTKAEAVEPQQPVRLVQGETDGELPSASAEPGETEGAVAPPVGEDPPPVADANQPVAPGAEEDAGAVADPNLDPAHLEQARKDDMTEREKRAARARAARKAYER